uniref:EF-hand domain-containing protein n=1 Tax=Anolis carolinensis TaxID=28377 RepID=H9GE90_ANOCA
MLCCNCCIYEFSTKISRYIENIDYKNGLDNPSEDALLLKMYYYYSSLDFDDDGTLDKKDLEQLVNCLTGEGEDSRLSPVEMEQLIQNVIRYRQRRDHHLSEFQHIISRSPDFTSFSVNLR